MHYRKSLLVALIALGFIVCQAQKAINVLVFSKTAGFRHESIGAGVMALTKLAKDKNFTVNFTEDASLFNEKNLQNYHVVVFLSTTGDVFNKEQESAFERYIQAGGGYVGVHAATDTEYDWPWYNKLAGAWFLDHPNSPSNVQNGTFHVVKRNELTEGMPDAFDRNDEFYNFKDISSKINVVVTIDEKTYIGGKNGDDHPISWYQEFDGGRSFYTAMGHTNESFTEHLFMNHLYAGIKYAAGGEVPTVIDFKKARPEENRFAKVVLEEKLDEPMELTVLDNDRILFIQRKGEVRLYNSKSKSLKTISKIAVSTEYTNAEGKKSMAEDGLLGLNKDPNFANNQFIYLYYSSTKGSYNVLSRFTMKGDDILLNSEIEMLKVNVQREECCHTGGSIEWDREGNLYLSTGDNTNPHGSDGFSPSDERKGRSPWDAQKSSANTNDLRGKILRIKPQSDGSYSIPEGNLYAKGTSNTRPEIYTMGHRNPFRISIDQKTGYLYWGDVGPDGAKADDTRGPAGHDEMGQAKGPGNFGWPHFVGDNKAYNKYDFENKKSLDKWNANAPVNTSPNNTGLQNLPPAQSAFVWYPYDKSSEFPIVGTGGRNAMAGPVLHRDRFTNAANLWPKYYDGKLFLYEWMRGWIMAVTTDKNGNLVNMEHFMPSYKFSNPMDMEFAPNGDLYMLEYGTGWFTQNDDARLIRIEYNGGNRKPQIAIKSDKPGGKLPLSLKLDATASDPDGDAIVYAWTISSSNGFNKKYKTPQVNAILKKQGVYKVNVTADDGKGGKSSQAMEIVVGNELPEVTIDFPNSNKTFYAANKSFDYDVKVSDQEDGSIGEGIAPDQVSVSIDYLAEGYDKNMVAMGHQDADYNVAYAKGKKLIEGSDCLSCHKRDAKSIGPSYVAIAKKYKASKDGVEYVTKKIISGGANVWGETAMAAHPQLSTSDAVEMAQYILNIETELTKKTMPVQGTKEVRLPKSDKGQGVYIVRAAYQDGGASNLPSLKGDASYVLRNAKVDVHAFDAYNAINKVSFGGNNLALPNHNSSMQLSNIDLNGIKSVIVSAVAPIPQANCKGGKIELRIDKADGTLLGTSDMLAPSEAMDFTPKLLSIPINLNDGKMHDVFLVFTNPSAETSSVLMVVMGVEFVLDRPDLPPMQEASTSLGKNYFVGNWDTTVKGTPNGDTKIFLTIEQDGDTLFGSMAAPDKPNEKKPLNKVEIIDDTKLKILFEFNGMNINMDLIKDDHGGFGGKLMGMLDIIGLRTTP